MKKIALEKALRRVYQKLGGDYDAPIKEIVATIEAKSFRGGAWLPATSPPPEDGEYLVQHFLMKNGLRYCPKIDREIFENGEWSQTQVTHWKPISYPREPRESLKVRGEDKRGNNGTRQRLINDYLT